MSRILAGVLGLLVLLGGIAVAEPPNDATYQGILRDASGRPLAGPVQIEVRIWDAEVGGELVYHEEHADVPLSGGVFHLLIGTGGVLQGSFDAGAFTDPERYLELVVNGETLAPRQPISSAPYAFAAQASRRPGAPWYGTWYADHQHIQDQGTVPVPSNRIVAFTKRYDDSILKITYTDNLRAFNYTNADASAGCAFHIYLDGKPCVVPAPIVGSVYTARSTYTNPHHIRTIVGLCSDTEDGPLLSGGHEVAVYVAETYADRNTGCYLGWNSTATLIVEELH